MKLLLPVSIFSCWVLGKPIPNHVPQSPMTVRMVPGMQTQNYSPAIQAPHQVQAVQPAQQIPAPGSSYLPPSNYFDNYQTNGYQQQQQALPPKMNSVPSQVATNSLYNQQPPMQQPVSLLPKSQPPVVLAPTKPPPPPKQPPGITKEQFEKFAQLEDQKLKALTNEMEKLRRALENTNQQQAQKDQETQANFESWEQKFNSLYENLKAVETRLLNALPLIQQDMGKVQSRLGKQAESLKNQRMMLNGINKKSDEDFKHLKQKQYNMHVRIEEMNGIVGSVLKLMEDQRSFKKYGR